MPRAGLNCKLSYPDGKVTRVYRVRCSDLQYGFEMIADESQSRVTKAFYPHQTAPTQFSLTIDLIGIAERDDFNAYLTGYANLILDPGLAQSETPQMTVMVPSRKFVRRGVPVRGWEFGNRTGAMLFQPQVVFETSAEPLDWSDPLFTSTVFDALANSKDSASRFFYPTGTQLNGNDAPQVPGLGAIQAVVSGRAPVNDSTDGTDGSGGSDGSITDSIFDGGFSDNALGGTDGLGDLLLGGNL